MSGQPFPRLLATAVLGAGIVGLVAAGAMFRMTDPAATSADGQPVAIPEFPATEPPPPAGKRAFEQPLFHRNRAPGPDGPPAAPASDPSDPSGPAQTASTGDAAGFKLKGVIINDRVARVAIQGANATAPVWVSKGQQVDGWTVETITAAMVRLRNGDEVAELKFSRDE